jgi:glycosyltransferase involved in cell wall biosynthesis
MRRADVNFVLNEPDREFAVGELGVDRKRICVVPNGVPERLPLTDDGPRRSGPATPVTRIVQIGSYLPGKGIAYGAAALSALLAEHPGIRVAFLGTRCSRERVLANFASVLHPRIDVLERYRNEELADLLGPGDVNLLPTLTEGFGLTVLEAMARGLPSVVTATPGPNEFCRHEVNALVVPAADPTALHRALGRLIDDGALRDRLSRAAVATAGERTWPRVAARNLDIYQSRLASKCDLAVVRGRQT